MSKLFGYVFWGLLLALLDFKINGFDLLPDFVGYILMGAGATGLGHVSPRFRLAGACCFLLAVASFMAIFLGGSDVAMLFGLFFIALDCAMLWNLLGGIRDYSLEKARADLAERANALRIAYLAVIAPVWMLSILVRNSPSLALGIALLVIVGLLIVMVLILRLIYRVRYELAAREDSLWDDPPRQ